MTKTSQKIPLRDKSTVIGFEVFTAVVMKSSTFCDISLCSPLKANRPSEGTCQGWKLQVGFLLGLFFDHEYGSNMFLRNIGGISTDYTASYPRRQNSSRAQLYSFRQPFINNSISTGSAEAELSNKRTKNKCVYCDVHAVGLRSRRYSVTVRPLNNVKTVFSTGSDPRLYNPGASRRSSSS
jgi:hypothetical protein